MAENKLARGALEGDEMHQIGYEEADAGCKSAKAIRLLREVTTVQSKNNARPRTSFLRPQEEVLLAADCWSLELESWKPQELLCSCMIKAQELFAVACSNRKNFFAVLCVTL